jgi:hypothetical protein
MFEQCLKWNWKVVQSKFVDNYYKTHSLQLLLRPDKIWPHFKHCTETPPLRRPKLRTVLSITARGLQLQLCTFIATLHLPMSKDIFVEETIFQTKNRWTVTCVLLFISTTNRTTLSLHCVIFCWRYFEQQLQIVAFYFMYTIKNVRAC